MKTIDDYIREAEAEARGFPRDSSKAPLPQGPITAAQLEHLTFAEPRSVVPGLFIEGLTLFAGKPKVGKSWLMLHAGLAVAQSGFTLGELACPHGGDVLYCALEDTQARLHRRISKLAAGWPGQLHLLTELPRLASGGLAAIHSWITSVSNPRLVMIDTLELVREKPKNGENSYSADYTAILTLRKLAADQHLAIVVVHHLRKAEADDPFDTISGTLGLTGAPDAILVLQKNGDGYTLHGRGRDLEDFERPIRFDKSTCLWNLGSGLTPKRDPWQKNKTLTLFHRALTYALDIGGKTIRPFPDGQAVRAVDLELVRAEFYKTHPGDGPPGDKNKPRRLAFDRGVTRALNASLIVSREIDGTQFLWLAS